MLPIGVTAGILLVAAILGAFVVSATRPSPSNTESRGSGVVREVALESLGKARVLADRTSDAAALRGIASACNIYSAQNSDRMPPDLFAIVSAGTSPKLLKSRLSSTPVTTVAPRSLSELNSRCDWNYVGADLWNGISPANRVILAYAKDFSADHGRNVVFMDCHAEWIEVADLNGVFERSNAARAAAGLPPVHLDGPPPKPIPSAAHRIG